VMHQRVAIVDSTFFFCGQKVNLVLKRQLPGLRGGTFASMDCSVSNVTTLANICWSLARAAT